MKVERALVPQTKYSDVEIETFHPPSMVLLFLSSLFLSSIMVGIVVLACDISCWWRYGQSTVTVAIVASDIFWWRYYDHGEKRNISTFNLQHQQTTKLGKW
jgi:hypothetical protein